MDSANQPDVFVPRLPEPGISVWKVFFTGLLLYVIGLAALVITGNPNLFPTVVMIGNFLVPVIYVAFFYNHRHLSTITLPRVAAGFVYGGLLGVFAATLLEPIFIRQLTLGTLIAVGFIEEFAKILGVAVIARHWQHDVEMDGLILGAAAGMGFAAFESSGYAFTAFLQSGGSLSTTVAVTLLRGFLAPFGHGTWTAIMASVLFRESRQGHFRLNLKVIGAYLIVSILHSLWDVLPGLIASLLGSGPDVVVGQAVIGFTGLFILVRRWREARRLQLERAQ
jgi:RsiW-degrading membrane proteinase PrsW (M82 family)